MFESTALIAALKPAALAVIACAMTYTAVAVDRWRLLRLVPTPVDGTAPAINLAMAIRMAAVGVALAGSLSGLAYSGVQGDLGPAALLLIFEGLLMMVLVSVATAVADIVVVPEIPNTEAIRNGNVAVALVEGAVLVATGQIAGASFANAATTDLIGGLISALVFFALGQALLCLIAFLMRKLSSVDVIRSLEEGRLALALVLAAKLFAAGYVMSSVIAGPTPDLVEDLESFARNALIAAVAFAIAYFAGLSLFGLTRLRAAVALMDDLPRAVRMAGLVMVAAFVASVSM